MVRTVLVCCALVGSPSGDGEKAPAQAARDRAAYESAESKLGRDADSHIRLALWCEAHGLTAERFKHLSLAVAYNPANTLARGLLGLVAYHGKWDHPGIVGGEIQNDPARQTIVREYLDRRARTPDSSDAQMKLAGWCEENGLKDEAIAHFTAVTRLDPSRDAAWKHLGYRKQGIHWFKPEELTAAKLEAARQKLADKHWRARLEKLRDGLMNKDREHRAKAERGLSEVTDPRAVPMIWSLFVRGGERQQGAAVQMLGQIDGPSASSGLGVLAVFSPFPDVRRRAIETLRRRDPRDVVGRLIGLVKKPYKYEVRHVNGPGSPGELFVLGERFNILRFYQNQTATPALAAGRLFTADVAFDPYSIRNITLATMTGLTTDPSGTNLVVQGKPGYSISMPVPMSTPRAAAVGQAIAMNPQDAAALLQQLAANPANLYGSAAVGFPTAHSGPSGVSAHGTAPGQSVTTDPSTRSSIAAMGVVVTAEAQAARRDILIAQQLEMIREANQDLQERLTMDVHFLDVSNDTINLVNDRALLALKAITGQDLGVEPEKWKGWWTDQLGYVYHSEVPVTKPTFTDFVAEAVLVPSYVHAACFAAGTLVQTLDGPRPIESIRVGDRVLSQGTSTGELAFEPVMATHRNPPSPTFRINVGGETILATGIHRFWKAGKGWTMARELRAGEPLRKVGGTVMVDSIGTDRTQPVFNLEVAENRDFFVGTNGLLVHDFSFVQPVLQPFDHPSDLIAVPPSGQ